MLEDEDFDILALLRQNQQQPEKKETKKKPTTTTTELAQEASKINLSFRPTAIEMPSPCNKKKITKHEQRALERKQRKIEKEEKKKAIEREASSSARKIRRADLENSTPMINKTSNFLDNMHG